MNARTSSLLLALFAGLALAGCKTMDHSAYQPPPKAVAPGTTYQPRIEEDTAYVAYVENMARIRGITVRWVNKPVKRHADQ
jgi:pectin methylesterase-like acyl-CoA thioesterase